ncbi:MAG TPA: hypothetical protein VJT10_00670 [Steroidobacteraceae bacterium]|nr:hypothetical protein [Steroidobacteraceae bacterium]
MREAGSQRVVGKPAIEDRAQRVHDAYVALLVANISGTNFSGNSYGP